MTTVADHDDFLGRSAGTALDPRLPSGLPVRVRAWISAALGVVIFLAGVICGAAVMSGFTEPKRPNWSELLDRCATRMQHDLDLTEPQQANIHNIVRAHQPELDRIRARTIDEMRTELQQVIEEMSAVLTPDQASRFRSDAQPRLDKYFPPDGEKRATKRTPR